MHNHCNSEHANGHHPNGEVADEAELDAYEERLTNEAVLDQVKVYTFLYMPTIYV